MGEGGLCTVNNRGYERRKHQQLLASYCDPATLFRDTLRIMYAKRASSLSNTGKHCIASQVTAL